MAKLHEVKEIAKRYSVSPMAVLAWIHAGELVAINVGRGPNEGKPRGGSRTRRWPPSSRRGR